MVKNMKVKSAAFNLNDPLQTRLYNHSTSYHNFSFYIKSLIQSDMEKHQPVKSEGIKIKLS